MPGAHIDWRCLHRVVVDMTACRSSYICLSLLSYRHCFFRAFPPHGDQPWRNNACMWLMKGRLTDTYLSCQEPLLGCHGQQSQRHAGVEHPVWRYVSVFMCVRQAWSACDPVSLPLFSALLFLSTLPRASASTSLLQAAEGGEDAFSPLASCVDCSPSQASSSRWCGFSCPTAALAPAD